MRKWCTKTPSTPFCHWVVSNKKWPVIQTRLNKNIKKRPPTKFYERVDKFSLQTLTVVLSPSLFTDVHCWIEKEMKSKFDVLDNVKSFKYGNTWIKHEREIYRNKNIDAGLQKGKNSKKEYFYLLLTVLKTGFLKI